MNRTIYILFLVSCILFSFSPGLMATETGQNEKLLGILFYKSNCSDCRILINKILPDVFSNTNSTAGILAINNSSPKGSEIYLEILLERNLSFSLNPPILVTPKNTWKNMADIQVVLPNLLSSTEYFSVKENSLLNDLLKLSKGKKIDIDLRSSIWVDRNMQIQETSLLNLFIRNFKKDSIANGLAVVVLLGMIISLAGIFIQFLRRDLSRNSAIPLLYPILNIAAFLVAFYLFYSGVSQNELSCGPVGECNLVQQSQYSKLLGLFPVSLLGMLSYAVCLSVWVISRIGPENLKDLSYLIAWGTSTINVLFFIYLTFLEPFIIGATCIWCVTSAVLTTISSALATKPAKSAFHNLSH